MMKIKNRKGKIHPSPLPPTHHAAASQDSSLSVLHLLPAAILTLIAALTLNDREVLAYMITRSLKTTTTSSIHSSSSPKLYRNDKQTRTVNGGGGGVGVGAGIYHKSPVFDCECFECYTSFWYRWDSSPNREVIHQAIEAFEEHLLSREVQTKRSGNRRAKKKDKLPVQKLEKIETEVADKETLTEENSPPVEVVTAADEVLPDKEEAAASVVERAAASVVERAAAEAGGHKGFARKVLPDVLGVFNSRLWNLWGPNV